MNLHCREIPGFRVWWGAEIPQQSQQVKLELLPVSITGRWEGRVWDETLPHLSPYHSILSDTPWLWVSPDSCFLTLFALCDVPHSSPAAPWRVVKLWHVSALAGDSASFHTYWVIVTCRGTCLHLWLIATLCICLLGWKITFHLKNFVMCSFSSTWPNSILANTAAPCQFLVWSPSIILLPKT